MCELTSAAYIAAALAAAGTTAPVIGQQQSRDAEQRAIAAEALRQQEFSDRQRAAVDTGRQAFEQENIQDAQAKAGQQREDAYRTAAEPSIPTYLPGQENAPQVVRDAVDQRRAANASTLGEEAKRKAALESWADALLGGRIAVNRSGQGVAREASFAQGSMEANKAERAAAKQKGSDWRFVGDLLNGAAMVVGAGGYRQRADARERLDGNAVWRARRRLQDAARQPRSVRAAGGAGLMPQRPSAWRIWLVKLQMRCLAARARYRQVRARARGAQHFALTAQRVAVRVADIAQVEMDGFPSAPGVAVMHDGTRHDLPTGTTLSLCGRSWPEVRAMSVLFPTTDDDGSIRLMETPVAGWAWIGGAAGPITPAGTLMELPDDAAWKLDGRVATVGTGEFFASVPAYQRWLEIRHAAVTPA
ncbi:hypothetical protein JYK14_05840 [Siccirubricoccus sp. KC 17139]|uniref:Uncharacterized protein n=1 Tax=Siccirubricoccus soli TaxID=2899147 RepID=A0ABT1D1E0_9PROT|nr:hypothetical protein [Siccirubricoccus soli]MCO6415699.1 hypothetical protein [Siccirubricoccus soli]MCP2681831.1 hypothetical protein [Siccirubricoccus soli]